MGQGGKITLVNGTKYDWVRSYQHSYQMNSWNFPDKILSGKTATVYVEWDQGVFKTESDDGGEATYTLNGINQSFQIQARATNGFNLQVALTGIATSGNPQGSTINLGWSHDGVVVFILSGESGHFTSSNIPTSWMQDSLSILGNRSLRHLCIPGSHDAGMSTRASGTAGGFECNTLTQTTGILGQLQYGMRYFDIRPVIGGGNQLLTGHYGHLFDKTWQGANGQSIQSVIDNVNTYTASNKELIVLYLSHSLNTEVGNNSYRSFDQAEWDRLLMQLTDSQHGLKNLFIANDPTNVDLTTLTLNTFISGRAAVIVVVDTSGDTSMNLGDYAKKGFYKPSNFPVYNAYSETNDLNKMTSDQLAKMKAQRTTPDSSYFLLSWTLTQDSTQAANCNGARAGAFAGGIAGSVIPGVGTIAGVIVGTAVSCILSSNSIKDLANIANPSLYEMLLPNCSSQCYPNILYIDNVQTSSIAALAMAVNNASAF